jgi:hypothetical protein
MTKWLTDGPFQRYRWLLPTFSFAAGWLGFALIERSEAMARIVALMALIGWPWLLAENALSNGLVRLSRERLSPKLVSFVTQSLQQEILFFALPFLLAATQSEPGQIAFTSLVALVALASSIDPIYFDRIAAKPGVSIAFHGFCTFVASLVVLPMAAALPLEQALPLAILITGAWLLLCVPKMLLSLRDDRWRAISLTALAVAMFVVWQLRAHLPPAGLSLRSSRITQSVDNLEPGPPLKKIATDSILTHGVVAFVRIRAPVGLSQDVFFEWWHRGERLDRIQETIQGGSLAGYRTYSRKVNIPADPRGRWRVDVLTPEGQLICRLRFEVVA